MRISTFFSGFLAALLVLAASGTATASSSTESGGWNDWSCTPTAEHPEPVVLMHGLGGGAQSNWFYHAPKLAAQGYCTYSLDFGVNSFGIGGTLSMRDSAVELDQFVDKVLAATGASEVDVIGHSAGTTVTAYYLKFVEGADKVKRFVGFGSNFHGTTLLGLDTLAKTLLAVLPGADDAFQKECPACKEFLPGSQFLADLAAGGVSVPGVEYTTIVSKYDEVVTPYTSGLLEEPGVKNIVLQETCKYYDYSAHLSQAIDPNVARLISEALDADADDAIRCSSFFAPL